jgi:hypothetical protein
MTGKMSNPFAHLRFVCYIGDTIYFCLKTLTRYLAGEEMLSLFREHKFSWPCSQELTVWPCPESVQCNKHPLRSLHSAPFRSVSVRSVLILYSHLRLGLASCAPYRDRFSDQYVVQQTPGYSGWLGNLFPQILRKNVRNVQIHNFIYTW